jgi:hypothetical protein
MYKTKRFLADLSSYLFYVGLLIVVVLMMVLDISYNWEKL